MKTLITAMILFTAAVVFLACSEGKLSNQKGENSAGADTSVSNGEKIYINAIDDEGNQITYTGGPQYGMMGMMGGRIACVSCHGSDGKGGTHYMMMQQMTAPDIRWKVLTGEMRGVGQSEEDYEHERIEHKGYDFDKFKMSIEEGLHPDGDTLKPEMPRWQMNDDDLRALMNYIKTLD